VSEWQPIETAPKDGTWILAYEEPRDPHSGFAVVAWWQHQWKRYEPAEGGLYREITEDGYSGWEGCPHSPWRATHWMHLPERPK
jgi:hypothetical protein